MTQATKKLTFEEYLTLEAEDWVKLGLPEGRCEYRDGEIVELPQESGINDDIANYLFLVLVSAGIPLSLVKPGKCEIEVPIVHPKDPRTRYPDLVLLREEHLPLIEKRLTIRLTMPEPRLVVEVVSPGSSNRGRDYKRKRVQYEQRGIPEFWLVDPKEQHIQVLELKDETYSEIGTFQGDEWIESPLLQALKLRLVVRQVLAAGK